MHAEISERLDALGEGALYRAAWYGWYGRPAGNNR